MSPLRRLQEPCASRMGTSRKAGRCLAAREYSTVLYSTGGLNFSVHVGYASCVVRAASRATAETRLMGDVVWIDMITPARTTHLRRRTP